MPDREKVINGLECLAQKQEPMANPCSKCDYHDRPNFAFCVVDVATDALALLKEQETNKEKAINYLLEIGWLQEHDAILSGCNPNAENQPCPPMPKAVKLK